MLNNQQVATLPSIEKMGLNEQQEKATTCNAKDIMVLAGTGTGKTKTIVARAAYLIDTGIAPQRILLMTFTRRAAREMQNRLEGLVGKEKAADIHAGTFHHFCLATMRHAPKLFGLEKMTVIDQDDSENLFKLVRADFVEPKSTDSKIFPKASVLARTYSYARNTEKGIENYLQSGNTFSKEEIPKALSVLKGYENLKKKYGYLDFDDILCLFAEKIHSSAQVSKLVKGLFDHILVDEMQDTNPVQWRILDGLRDPAALFCVGDDAQSIYSFRGADFHNVHSFSERIPGGVILKLETNYRSTQGILDLSNWLIGNSPLNYGRELKAVRGNGLQPQLISCLDEFSEAKWIADDVKKVAEDDTKLREIMILTRTAWRSRTMETELISAQIPYIFIGGLSLMKAAHVKDVFSLLRASLSNTDRLAWLRYLMFWKGIGEKWAAKAFNMVSQAKGLDEALKVLPEQIPKSAKELGIAENVMEVRKSIHDPKAAMHIARKKLNKCLSQHYDKWDLRSKDLELLEKVAGKYNDLGDFLETYTLDPVTTTQLTRPSVDDALPLITVHSAKGTEAKVCYILGAEPGQFPHYRSIDVLVEGDAFLSEGEEGASLLVRKAQAYGPCLSCGVVAEEELPYVVAIQSLGI